MFLKAFLIRSIERVKTTDPEDFTKSIVLDTEIKTFCISREEAYDLVQELQRRTSVISAVLMPQKGLMKI